MQNGGLRVWEATVPGVELRPLTDLVVSHANLIMRGLTLNVRLRTNQRHAYCTFHEIPSIDTFVGD